MITHVVYSYQTLIGYWDGHLLHSRFDQNWSVCFTGTHVLPMTFVKSLMKVAGGLHIGARKGANLGQLIPPPGI